MEAAKSTDLYVLCCTYQMDAFETYKKSLIISIIMHIMIIFGTISNKNMHVSMIVLTCILCTIFIIWAVYLLINAPSSYMPLTDGLRKSADWFAWFQVIYAWTEYVFVVIMIAMAAMLVLFTKNAQGAAGTPGAADPALVNTFATAVIVMISIMAVVIILFATIMLQAGKNILRVLDAVSNSQDYFQTTAPINQQGGSSHEAAKPVHVV
jgi:hypothetical protein